MEAFFHFSFSVLILLYYNIQHQLLKCFLQYVMYEMQLIQLQLNYSGIKRNVKACVLHLPVGLPQSSLGPPSLRRSSRTCPWPPPGSASASGSWISAPGSQ